MSASGRRLLFGLMVLLALLIVQGAGFMLIDRASLRDIESNLRKEAVQYAQWIAADLEAPEAGSEAFIRSIVMRTMEDRDIWGVVVLGADRMLEGQRRLNTGQSTPWDGVHPHKLILGTATVEREGLDPIRVSVLVDPRLSEERIANVRVRLIAIFCATGLGLVAAILALLHLTAKAALSSAEGRRLACEVVPDLAISLEEQEYAKPGCNGAQKHALPEWLLAGRNYLCSRPEGMDAVACCFRQTFAEAPALAMRLYEAGYTNELVQLTDAILAAAPIVGADRLLQLAQNLAEEIRSCGCGQQAALSLFVEELQHVLAQLGLGAGQADRPLGE